MKYKTLLQVFLISIAIILSGFFYFKYFNKSKIIETTKEEIGSNKNEINSSSGNKVINISYESYDNNGNNYLIKSDSGNFSEENKEEIFMINVSAKINLKNGTTIFLESKNAIYNTVTNDTNFYNEVKLIYLDHKINSNNLDISFKNNKLEAYNDLVYTNLDVNLVADKAELDLLTLDSKIYMFDNSQVKIIKD